MNSRELILKFALAKKNLREIASEWLNSEDADAFREEHIESYGSRLSFDELIKEIESIKFK